MTPDPASPADHHRRQLARFARWLSAALAAPDDYRAAVFALARRIDAAGMTRADTLACLDELDDLIAGRWDRTPEDEP